MDLLALKAEKFIAISWWYFGCLREVFIAGGESFKNADQALVKCNILSNICFLKNMNQAFKFDFFVVFTNDFLHWFKKMNTAIKCANQASVVSGRFQVSL